MNFPSTVYDMVMYPIEKLRLNRMRRKLVAHAYGEVLEIGTGTGVNVNILPCEKITAYTGLDIKIKTKVKDKMALKQCPFHLVDGSVEDLPFEDETFDTVLFTLVFCSVEHPEKGLSEIYRVLKPGGRLIFIEHVLPNRPFLDNILRRLTPYWKRVADNCHLDRRTHLDIEQMGFKICCREFSFREVFVGGVAKK